MRTYRIRNEFSILLVRNIVSCPNAAPDIFSIDFIRIIYYNLAVDAYKLQGQNPKCFIFFFYGSVTRNRRRNQQSVFTSNKNMIRYPCRGCGLLGDSPCRRFIRFWRRRGGILLCDAVVRPCGASLLTLTHSYVDDKIWSHKIYVPALNLIIY